MRQKRQIIMCLTFQCVVKEKMEERKMNRQGIRGLQRKTASLKMLSLLNASGRKWEEACGQKENTERKKENHVKGEKKGGVKESSYTHQSISKMTLQAVRLEWCMSGYLGNLISCTDTHEGIRMEVHHPSAVTSEKSPHSTSARGSI